MRFVALLLFFVLTAPAYAQESGLFFAGRQQPVVVSFSGVYQTYAQDDVSISETSFPLAVVVPLGRRAGMSLRASQASVTGDTLQSLGSVSDVQLGLSFRQPLGSTSLIASLGVNLPTGKSALTSEEFRTAILASQHYFSFRVPGFGQGLNVSPGLAWAVPVGETMVLGLGVSYQYRGGYEPVAEAGTYDPGDEVVLTGGVDFRLAPTTNVSADVSYAMYGSDALEGEQVFDAGDKLTATAQLRQLFGYNELALVARYRSVAKSRLPVGPGGGAGDELRTLPAQLLLRGRYDQHVSESVTIGALVQARILDETVSFVRATLFDAGLLPRVHFTDSVAAHGRFVYTLGDITGLEAGAGLSVSL